MVILIYYLVYYLRLIETRVVFEFKTSDGILRPAPRLIETRVVFECINKFSIPYPFRSD